MRSLVVMLGAVLALAVTLRAQSTLERPQPGVMLDRAGRARPIYGVAGSVTVGDAVATGATAAACSERVCLVKTESAILSLGKSASRLTEAPAGPALFALDGDAAFVYFSRSRRLMRWTDGQFEPMDPPVPEAIAQGKTIVSLRVKAGALEFAMAQEDGTWIARSDGSLVEFVTGEAGPVLLLRQGVLFATADNLVLRRSDGSETRFDVAGVTSLLKLGKGYAEARTAEAAYAIKIEQGREQIFLLPESQP